MDGHASDAPESLSDLASFLGDTSDRESPDEDLEHDESDDSTAEGDTEDEESDGQEESEDDESDDEEAEDTPAPERKLKVTVKGDDGTDQEIEVDEAEVVKGYQRQADYTRKTQELAQREHQAVEILKAKHDEFAQDYLSKAEASRAAIVQLAGLKGEDEMAQLAQSDPAAWVAENQRRQSIVAVLGHLDQQISAERQEIERWQAEAMQQARSEMFHRTWAELQKDGIDREKLGKAYSDVSKAYGFSGDELAQVLDHRQVRVMLDALAYRQLKEQKTAVQKKVDAAPKLPQKATPTVKDRKSQQLEGRFKGGRAKLNDLASYLR